MCDFIQELKNDHRVIQQVVAGMSAVAELLDSGKQVDPSVLVDLVQFLRVFADQCHHEKEEQHLFPLLATSANVSTRRELESLEREHRSAKQLVGQLAKVAAVYVHNPQWCGKACGRNDERIVRDRIHTCYYAAAQPCILASRKTSRNTINGKRTSR